MAHQREVQRIGPAVLRDAEQFLTDRGADGLEGTGLVAFHPDGDGWGAQVFVAPEQRGQRAELGCWVEVTEHGKRQLAVRLPVGCRYLARIHSHPAEAFHSRTDNRNPALTHEGAISIVVPYFGLGLRRGLGACAVYRLAAGRWTQLPSGPARDRWVIADG
ncbi:MAG TPA: hypothetical protein VMV92_22215 [Streptosporangiaceae bacterium]|nr:hypothetical protein [Streptosporangiaceae bacterium]